MFGLNRKNEILVKILRTISDFKEEKNNNNNNLSTEHNFIFFLLQIEATPEIEIEKMEVIPKVNKNKTYLNIWRYTIFLKI